MLSIVIPAYNVETYIIECLSSIEVQTRKDIEVIVVNDGSTDMTGDIVRNYIANSNLNIQLIDQDNAGASQARNTGILYCHGEYLCFVDADDMICANFAELMLQSLESNNSDVVICSNATIDRDIHEKGIWDQPFRTQTVNQIDALRKFLYHRITPGIWALVVRTKVFGDLRFAAGVKYSEDMEMVWKILANSNMIALIDAKLYQYRVRAGSAMSIVNDRSDGFELMQKLELYLREKTPEFSKEFSRYGVARWVWATMWQGAATSDSYMSFLRAVEIYSPGQYLRKLITYPQLKVKMTSVLFLSSKRMYYWFAKNIAIITCRAMVNAN
jgi:glycosyltransferase involved in cell wall biosynthesis